MLPFGLQFKIFKPIRKLPMRLEPISFEKQKQYYSMILNLSHTENKTRERKPKRNKTVKNK